MKLNKKSGLFVNSTKTLELDPSNYRSTSYGWYVLSCTIGGIVLLNVYPYSVTTRKHVALIRNWLIESGVDYVEVNCPKGLQDLTAGLDYCSAMVSELIQKSIRAKSRRSIVIREMASYSTQASILKTLSRGAA